MATKEVMVTAPVLVFLYDRTFFAGTFREAWRRQWKIHLGLASTWLLLVVLVAGAGWDRGGAAGFDVGVKPWHYWLTQPEAILRYLWLAVWPHPLVFDYGTFFYRSFGPIWWQALLVCLMLVFSMAAILWKPAAGFLSAWFFGILAVTSVVPGTIQMIVEHRMYLPLAAVITGAVLAVNAGLNRLQDHRTTDHGTRMTGGPVVRGPAVSGLVVCTVALALGLLTHHRNATYRTELALWQDTVAKWPDSPRAHNALAFALDKTGRTAEAIAEFDAALRLAPDNADLHDNLGVTLARAGRTADALAQFETALRLRPDFPTAHCNLGNALVQAGKPAEAIPQYETALRLKSGYADAEYDLAGALDLSGQPAAALPHLEAAVRLKPDFAGAHFSLGDLLNRLGRPADATKEYEAALRLDPALAQAQADLGVLLCRSGQTDAGLAHLREAVRLQPGNVPTRFNLGVALLRAGQSAAAAAEFKAVLRLRPDYAPARHALEQIRGGGAP